MSVAGILVDSSVLLDVILDDPAWADWSDARLTEAATHGPVIVNAVVLAEVSPPYRRYEDLVGALPAACRLEAIPAAAAFLAGHAHATYRRAGGTRAATLPDFLIGAHAAVTGRPLLTRDPRRVAEYIPGARLVTPDS